MSAVTCYSRFHAIALLSIRAANAKPAGRTIRMGCVLTRRSPGDEFDPLFDGLVRCFEGRR